MPRKTLALISGLILVTVVLFFIALKTSEKSPQQSQQPQVSPVASQPSPMVPAHTLLSLSPLSVNVASGQQGKVDVTIDTSDNAITAVQVELAYDPKVISNVQVASGPMFKNPVVLINKNDPITGRFTYAFGILPNHETIQGVGVVATVTFTAKGVSGKESAITLLPESLVTARGVAESVRKNSTDPIQATIMIGAGTGGVVTPKTSIVPSVVTNTSPTQ